MLQPKRTKYRKQFKGRIKGVAKGGSELAFDMPKISRDMIVVIQALVILFTGALENLVRIPVERLFLWRRRVG